MAVVDLRAFVRGGALDGEAAKLAANERRELLTAQGLPRYTEATRQGNGWSLQTATLFAPLVAIPTTVAALEIYNNYAALSLIIDTLFASQVVSTAASQTYAIYACVSTQKAAPANTALSIFSSNGRAVRATTAAGGVIAGIGTTVVANGWRPWGTVQAWGTATATPGNSWHVDIEGRLIVPPGCALLLHIMGALATASTFQVGASWYEDTITNAV